MGGPLRLGVGCDPGTARTIRQVRPPSVADNDCSRVALVAMSPRRAAITTRAAARSYPVPPDVFVGGLGSPRNLSNYRRRSRHPRWPRQWTHTKAASNVPPHSFIACVYMHSIIRRLITGTDSQTPASSVHTNICTNAGQNFRRPFYTKCTSCVIINNDHLSYLSVFVFSSF